ncbi:uncharacterized protein CTRU02_215768 [Colletotrichum truncatum]|uniref:Uncharacterized protein n=1 Tax=Colletotrichum truncatum TaxID=5467 RepID=A0ACC3YBV2_COLTU
MATLKHPVITSKLGSKRQRTIVADSDDSASSEAPDVKRIKGLRVFQDGESAREQAQPYLILTARMPIRALSTQWSIGKNRKVDQRHVQRLYNIFLKGQLNRNAEGNHLFVLCNREATSKMVQHLHSQSRTDEEPLSFADWLDVNHGYLAEVMAGQHRVKALELYGQACGVAEEDLWWTCKFYDKDTLPLELNLGLRVNRADQAMPDSHGQTWVQLVAADSQDPDMFRGKAAEVEVQMGAILGLAGEAKFPIRRLGTIWRNERWRRMTTTWCESTVGRETFQISTWNWMISYRIDDFWFATFYDVLDTLNKLPGNALDYVSAADWKRLADVLSDGYADGDVTKLFYPSGLLPSPLSSPRSPIPTSSIPIIEQDESYPARRSGFLINIDNETYYQVHNYVIETKPRVSFANVHRLIRLSKEEGRALAVVLTHVVTWLNVDAQARATLPRRDNNKPPLRKDIIPVLGQISQEVILQAKQRVSRKLQFANTFSDAEMGSVLLQQEVLEYTLENLDAFRGPAAKALMDQPFADKRHAEYGARFHHPAWGGILHIIRKYVGEDFRPDWILRRQVVEDNPDNDYPALRLARSLCGFIKDAPEFPKDKLSIAQAIDSKAFQSALARWFSQEKFQPLGDTLAATREANFRRHQSNNMAKEATNPLRMVPIQGPSEMSERVIEALSRSPSVVDQPRASPPRTSETALEGMLVPPFY